jgi:hypothetical protein
MCSEVKRGLFRTSRHKLLQLRSFKASPLLLIAEHLATFPNRLLHSYLAMCLLPTIMVSFSPLISFPQQITPTFMAESIS